MQSLNVRIYRKVNKALDKKLMQLRKKQIHNHDFSIISNNCWAGAVYKRYGLPYLTPTVGLYFFADDFIKLCGDLKGYTAKKLEFIQYTESRYCEILEQKKQTQVPIARLGDIEIVFLHYANPEEAAKSWYRRLARINYDNLIFKFSMMNGCTEAHLEAFDQLRVSKKICFIPKNASTKIKCGIRYRTADGMEIKDDTSEYSRYVNLTKMINAEKVCGRFMEGKWRKK